MFVQFQYAALELVEAQQVVEDLNCRPTCRLDVSERFSVSGDVVIGAARDIIADQLETCTRRVSIVDYLV